MITRHASLRLRILNIFTADPIIPMAIKSFRYHIFEVRTYVKSKPNEIKQLTTSQILMKAYNFILIIESTLVKQKS